MTIMACHFWIPLFLVLTLTEILFERGYSDEDVEKILGENSLRVLRAVPGS